MVRARDHLEDADRDVAEPGDDDGDREPPWRVPIAEIETAEQVRHAPLEDVGPDLLDRDRHLHESVGRGADQRHQQVGDHGQVDEPGPPAEQSPGVGDEHAQKQGQARDRPLVDREHAEDRLARRRPRQQQERGEHGDRGRPDRAELPEQDRHDRQPRGIDKDRDLGHLSSPCARRIQADAASTCPLRPTKPPATEAKTRSTQGLRIASSPTIAKAPARAAAGARFGVIQKVRGAHPEESRDRRDEDSPAATTSLRLRTSPGPGSPAPRGVPRSAPIATSPTAPSRARASEARPGPLAPRPGAASRTTGDRAGSRHRPAVGPVRWSSPGP